MTEFDLSILRARTDNADRDASDELIEPARVTGTGPARLWPAPCSGPADIPLAEADEAAPTTAMRTATMISNGVAVMVSRAAR